MKSSVKLFNCINNSECIFNHFKNNYLPSLEGLEISESKIYIGQHWYYKKHVIEEIEDISKILRAEWYKVQGVINNVTLLQNEIISAREYIDNGFEAILQCLRICQSQEIKEKFIEKCTLHLKKFSTCIIPFSKLENSVILKLSLSSMNNINCLLYQYLHTYLDIQYYLLLIDYYCNKSEDEIEEKIVRILQDVLVMSKTSFGRNNDSNKSVFNCECMKKFWVIILMLTEKICINSRDYFWKIFNKVLENEEAFFVLWMLRDFANLHIYNSNLIIEGNLSDRINPNYSLFEMKLKDILVYADSELLVKTYTVVHPLNCNLWLNQAKIEVYQIMWDFYSKRLNVSNKKIPISKLSAIKICDIVDQVLWSTKNCKEDFEFFVSMLVFHLRKHPTHWPKMKGRIYSQIGPNKIKELSEIGVIHVIILFMSLAVTVNFEELSKKIISFLATYCSPEKKNTLLVWNNYEAFMLKHIQQGRSLENVAPIFVKKIQEAVSSNHFHLIRDFILTYEIIIANSTSMQLHQWVLLDPCLGKYLLKCYSTDLVKFLDVMLLILEKASNADSWSFWESTFKDNIYPILKQLAVGSQPLGIIGTIVGKLSLLIPSLVADAFSYFNSETISPQISANYVEIILENYPNNFMILPHQENIIIQSWSKVCFLTETPVELTKQIAKLDVFPNALKTHLTNSKEPLCALIEYLGCDIKQHCLSPNINKLCDLIFEHSCKFLTPFLNNTDNDVLVYRVYKLVSVAFLSCGNLLYNRNKISCPLTSLTQCLLFPVDFLTGKKSLSVPILNAVNKTWHIFFEAYVKLNINNADSYLERTLKNLLTKYLPYFSVADSPIIKCLDNEQTASVILEKLASCYLKNPVREADANVHKALTILKQFVQSTTSVPIFKLIIQHVLFGLFEVVIFHTQRNTAVSVLQVITCSPLYHHTTKQFQAAVVAVTNKYLQFNSETYFQLIIILSKFVPCDIKSVLPNIRDQVINAERLRGVGFDKSLRMQLEKLQNALDS